MADLARHLRNLVEQRSHLADVVGVGRRHTRSQGDAVGIGDHMVLAAGLGPVYGTGAGLRRRRRPPARSCCRSAPAPRRSCRRPAACPAGSAGSCPRSRLAASPAAVASSVIPQPQFISQGRSSQGKPVLRMKRMPVRAARSEMGGWPPLGLGVHSGSNGSMISHSCRVGGAWP